MLREELVELYKVCAERHENITKSVWVQFNYLAIGVGALVAFARERFLAEVLILLVSLPLLFWFFGTFEPLNQYADQTVAALAEAEVMLNDSAKHQGAAEYPFTHYKRFQHPQRPEDGSGQRSPKMQRAVVIVSTASTIGFWVAFTRYRLASVTAWTNGGGNGHDGWLLPVAMLALMIGASAISAWRWNHPALPRWIWHPGYKLPRVRQVARTAMSAVFLLATASVISVSVMSINNLPLTRPDHTKGAGSTLVVNQTGTSWSKSDSLSLRRGRECDQHCLCPSTH